MLVWMPFKVIKAKKISIKGFQNWKNIHFLVPTNIYHPFEQQLKIFSNPTKSCWLLWWFFIKKYRRSSPKITKIVINSQIWSHSWKVKILFYWSSMSEIFCSAFYQARNKVHKAEIHQNSLKYGSEYRSGFV